MISGDWSNPDCIEYGSPVDEQFKWYEDTVSETTGVTYYRFEPVEYRK